VREYEEWRYVLNFPEYVVSNLGNIRLTGSYSGRPLTLTADDSGNLMVMLAVDGERRRLRLDRIVAASFLNPSMDQAMTRDIMHLDGDPFNCRADNLAWVKRKKRKRR
jgi:hypothetical protein